jgi:RNA polymerase sigma factor (sigma-70 family)
MTSADQPPMAIHVPPAAPATLDFTAFYRAEFNSIAALVQSFTGRRDAAEEIAQDAFVIAHARWSKVSGFDRPGAYVRRVALNRAVSGFRRSQAERRALDRMGHRAGATTSAAPDAVDQRLWAQVRALPARQAQVIALTYVEDRSVAQIAEILGTSESSVKTHLQRARTSLAAALADLDPNAPEQPGSDERGAR